MQQATNINFAAFNTPPPQKKKKNNNNNYNNNNYKYVMILHENRPLTYHNSSFSKIRKDIAKEFLAIRRAISLNETFVLFC